jgi:AraC family transcriptional regulator
MECIDNGITTIESSARHGTVTAYSFGGLLFTIRSVSSSESRELRIRSSRHVFACMLGGRRDEIARESWSGRPSPPRAVCRTDESLLVPRGVDFCARYDGRSEYRALVCEVDDLALARVLGDDAGPFDLSAYSGRSPIETCFAQRIEAFCLAPHAFPVAYGEALASLVVSDLFAAFAAKPASLQSRAGLGSSRFKRVLDFIEEHLERDISLVELASVVGLSVTHFAHAFKAQQGLAPYRYIMRRRIERSKRLLRTTDETIAAIAARSGFSSQSCFSRMFARDVGTRPSAYRSGPSHIQGAA